MSKNDLIEFEDCVVVEALPNTVFKVKLPNGMIVTATIIRRLLLTGQTLFVMMILIFLKQESRIKNLHSEHLYCTFIAEIQFSLN